MKVAGALGQQPHLNAIRDGVVSALPLVLIGSLFMLAFQPPLLSQGALDWYTGIHWVSQLPVAITILFKLITIFVAFGVAHSLAKRYGLDPLSAGLLAVAALLLINGAQSLTLLTPDGVAQLKSVGSVGKEFVTKGAFLPIANLGPGGMFVALLLGLLIPEVQRLAKRCHLEITMPDGVPPAVGRSFSALIPGCLVLIPLWFLVYVLGFNLFALFDLISRPLIDLSTGGASLYLVLLVIILIDSVLWLLGVHAVAILAPVKALWIANIVANATQGTHHLNTVETLQFFIWIGGSGTTVVLPFLLLRARSASLRAIAKIGAVPALFNINEPLIFGVPVMMNATLAIPFTLAPLLSLTTTVLAVNLGLVPVPTLPTPWTLPGPIGAFIATHGAWQAVLLSLVNIALAALIYWPFVRALDRKMAAQEATTG
jgi:PTS system cellobiose-specific IIC component